MLSTPHLEQLVNSVSRYIDSYVRSSIFKYPSPPKEVDEEEKMMTETDVNIENKLDVNKQISIRELRLITKQ